MKCAVCNKKLKMVELTIGKCRCDGFYCSKHRLPESHDCKYDFTLDKEKFIEENKCIAIKCIDKL